MNIEPFRPRKRVAFILQANRYSISVLDHQQRPETESNHQGESCNSCRATVALCIMARCRASLTYMAHWQQVKVSQIEKGACPRRL
jgi:hypothetical protein